MSIKTINIKHMPLKSKIQFILAAVLTVSVITAIPVLAWFNHQRKIAEMQKIKTPELLYISAAYAEDAKFFSIPSINVDPDTNPAHRQLFPFAVAGEYVSSFTLQMAHTTNVPFTYKIYEAEVYDSEEAAQEAIDDKNEELSGANQLSYQYDIVPYTVQAQWSKLVQYNFKDQYHEDEEDGFLNRSAQVSNTLYLVKGNQLMGTWLNDDGTGHATNLYHPESYEIQNGSYGNVQANAEPLYWQYANIPSVAKNGWGAKPFFKTFILELSWDPTEVSNDKETDMIYVSVYRD